MKGTIKLTKCNPIDDDVEVLPTPPFPPTKTNFVCAGVVDNSDFSSVDSFMANTEYLLLKVLKILKLRDCIAKRTKNADRNPTKIVIFWCVSEMPI